MARKSNSVPSYDDMLLPTLQALRDLGGSGTIQEINTRAAEIMNLSPAVLEVRHGETSSSEVEYRLAWSRTYLKKFGLLQNSSRGVWSLSSSGADAKQLDPKEIVRAVREQDKTGGSSKTSHSEAELLQDFLHEGELAWHQTYLNVLRRLNPASFERLIQRMLRESGFSRVDVTGRTGDGGIDGFGLATVNGFLSFRVLFQCKRYQGSVSPGEIRDFRGAMQGRTEKGLFVTTGTFTREAVREATRDGAPPVDLLDGEQLVQRLKELHLGVRISMVEAVEVDEEWFRHI